ncbi:hypothetical protein CEXT_81571 [Caerostris extrusa]|uniref:Uncharacterized protein n=1 Tax=Caerostris extrusa TaxID=172846 RepID=A0AAV4MYN2_CAEEX|nr:hypothetical protein CEXT_81571 [Caerostris extrusa]
MEECSENKEQQVLEDYIKTAKAIAEKIVILIPIGSINATGVKELLLLDKAILPVIIKRSYIGRGEKFHYNSVSHLHKLKLSMKENNAPNSTASTPVSSTSVASPSSPSVVTTSSSNASTLDIHVRSVLHQSKATRIQELVLSGELDLTSSLVERPDSNPSSEIAQTKTSESITTPSENSSNNLPTTTSQTLKTSGNSCFTNICNIVFDHHTSDLLSSVFISFTS